MQQQSPFEFSGRITTNFGTSGIYPPTVSFTIHADTADELVAELRTRFPFYRGRHGAKVTIDQHNAAGLDVRSSFGEDHSGVPSNRCAHSHVLEGWVTVQGSLTDLHWAALVEAFVMASADVSPGCPPSSHGWYGEKGGDWSVVYAEARERVETVTNFAIYRRTTDHNGNDVTDTGGGGYAQWVAIRKYGPLDPIYL